MNKSTIIAIIVALVVIVVAFYFIFGFSGKSEKQSTASSSDTLTNSSPAPTVGKLKVEDLKEGTGPAVKSGDTISINYDGWLADPSASSGHSSTKFDSSYDRGTPFETQIGVGQVIKGWDEGVIGMKVGGKRKLTIPPDLGYGSQGAGDKIPPNATLVFEVELIQIK